MSHRRTGPSRFTAIAAAKWAELVTFGLNSSSMLADPNGSDNSLLRVIPENRAELRSDWKDLFE